MRGSRVRAPEESRRKSLFHIVEGAFLVWGYFFVGIPFYFLAYPIKKAPLPTGSEAFLVVEDFRLLTDTQLSDEGTVTVQVFLLKVSQVTTTLTYEAQQCLTAAVVLTVRLQVVTEFLNAESEKGDLAFGRTGVVGVASVFCEDFLHLLFGEINWHS